MIYRNKKYLFLLIPIWLVVLGLASQVLASADGVANLPVNLGVANVVSVLYLVAFIGGILMILSPCSAAVIPAYFANTFGSKGKITQRTIVFFLGFSSVYAFIGSGASFIGRWLNIYIEPLAFVVGLLLIIFGLLIFSGRSFFSLSINKKMNVQQTTRGTFTFGAFFAIGFIGCAGPVLAGILTVASQLSTYQAILLMFFYSLGMGVPLVILSLIFDRYKIYNSRFFTWGKDIKIAGKTLHLLLPNIISGVLLIVLGLIFVIFQDSSFLSASFPRRVTEVGYILQNWLLSYNPPIYWDAILFVVIGFFLIKFFDKLFLNSDRWQLKINIPKIKLALILIIIAMFIFNSFLYFNYKRSFQKQIDIAEELARPAKLDIIILKDSNCKDCFIPNTLIATIKQENVKITSEKIIEVTSLEGVELINKYDIVKIPALIIKGEINKEENLKAIWAELGEVQKDTFILRQVGAPYILVDSGVVKGRVKWTMLTDDSCDECYNVSNHKAILSKFGILTKNQQIIDRQSVDGRALISKYNIKLLPTIILSGDLEVYPSLIKAWSQVGTIEEDGTYVFRAGVKQMGVYKDLLTNSIVFPTNKE